MANQALILLTTFLAMTWDLQVFASDSSPLQDFCIADTSNSVTRVNGLPCLDPKLATVEHFSLSGLDIPGNTSNPSGLSVKPVFVAQLPGLNTFGISLSRVDFAAGGVSPPHTHPRAAEIVVVLEGSLDIGFVTSNPEFKLFSKILKKGDVFVCPIGLVHYARNAGSANTAALVAWSSQNPGFIPVGNAVFGSNPPISEDTLSKAFQVDKSVIKTLQSKF